MGLTLTEIDKHMSLDSMCEKFKKIVNVFINFIKMTTNTHFLKIYKSLYIREKDRQTDKQIIFSGCYSHWKH